MLGLDSLIFFFGFPLYLNSPLIFLWARSGSNKIDPLHFFHVICKLVQYQAQSVAG